MTDQEDHHSTQAPPHGLCACTGAGLECVDFDGKRLYNCYVRARVRVRVGVSACRLGYAWIIYFHGSKSWTLMWFVLGTVMVMIRDGCDDTSCGATHARVL